MSLCPGLATCCPGLATGGPGLATGGPSLATGGSGMASVWASLGLPTVASLGTVMVGSVCSGMGAEEWALRQFPWMFKMVFWCEMEPNARKFLFDNFSDIPN